MEPLRQPNFDPDAHEAQVEEGLRRLAKYALFDEMVDYHLNGECTLAEALAQFEHDLAEM